MGINIFDYNRGLQKQGNALINKFKTFLLNSEDLVLFLQQEQLNDGLNNEGKLIGVYTAFTEILTNGRKKAGEPYNFQDTGSFFDEMFIKVQTSPEFSIIIDSRDSKTKKLEMEYPKLLGLTPQNTAFLSKKIKELFFEFLRTNTTKSKVLQNV